MQKGRIPMRASSTTIAMADGREPIRKMDIP